MERSGAPAPGLASRMGAAQHRRSVPRPRPSCAGHFEDFRANFRFAVKAAVVDSQFAAPDAAAHLAAAHVQPVRGGPGSHGRARVPAQGCVPLEALPPGRVVLVNQPEHSAAQGLEWFGQDVGRCGARGAGLGWAVTGGSHHAEVRRSSGEALTGSACAPPPRPAARRSGCCWRTCGAAPCWRRRRCWARCRRCTATWTSAAWRSPSRTCGAAPPQHANLEGRHNL
jgi:hypothetical protein